MQLNAALFLPLSSRETTSQGGEGEEKEGAKKCFSAMEREDGIMITRERERNGSCCWKCIQRRPVFEPVKFSRKKSSDGEREREREREREGDRDDDNDAAVQVVISINEP